MPLMPQPKKPNEPKVDKASKEEQEQYELAVKVAMKTLYDKKTRKQLFDMVTRSGGGGGKGLAKGIGSAVFSLIRRAEVEMETELMDSVVMELIEDLVMEVTNLLVETGRLDEGRIGERLLSDIMAQVAALAVQDADNRGELDPKDPQAQEMAKAVESLPDHLRPRIAKGGAQGGKPAPQQGQQPQPAPQEQPQPEQAEPQPQRGGLMNV